ncbi:MAG: hypothetical protein WA110_07480 [Anaerolineaceae bacterium]
MIVTKQRVIVLLLVFFLFSTSFSTVPVLSSSINTVYLPIVIKAPPPSPFNKNAPPDGAKDQPIQPILSWTVSNYATQYEYCYDTVSVNDCSHWISTGTDTFVQLPILQPFTKYYWQVRAWNGSYGPTYANGSSSTSWSFTTLDPFPAAFGKHAPTNYATEQSLTPILSWNISARATKYEYCYDTTYDGACSNWISTGTNTYVQLPTLLPGVTYYWQVRAWNGTYGPTYADGSSLDFWSFTTQVIQNGGFELGDVIWTEQSSSGFDLIMNTNQNLPVSPHNGSWLAWLGGGDNEISSLSQNITIPVGNSALQFWVWVASQDDCGYDVFGIFIGDDVVYSQWLCSVYNTNGWVQETVDLSEYEGTTQTLEFLVGLDGDLNSNLFLDDISFEPMIAQSGGEDFPQESSEVLLPVEDLALMKDDSLLTNHLFQGVSTPDYSRKILLLRNSLLSE